MLTDAIKELFPPDTPPVLRWRLAMFVFVMISVFHMLWSCSWIPGMSGFALASDIERNNRELEQKISKLEISVTSLAMQGIRSQLREAKRRQCEAIEDLRIGIKGAAERRDAASADLDRLKEEYAELHPRGLQWIEPNCANLY